MFANCLMMFHWQHVTSKILLDCSQKNQDKAFRTNSLRVAFADARLQCSAKFSDWVEYDIKCFRLKNCVSIVAKENEYIKNLHYIPEFSIFLSTVQISFEKKKHAKTKFREKKRILFVSVFVTQTRSGASN